MRNFILFTLIMLSISGLVNAQVGIGNATPDATSVLDLSNSGNMGLLMPSAASTAAMSASTGMLYFYNDNIFYRRSDGYNALSAWKFKFNGNITNDIYYNLGGNIGIGLADISVSPLAPLHIETDNALNLVDDGSFLIGKTTATSLAFNSTKIQTRNAGSASDLQLNEQGGDVIVGSAASPAKVKATQKVQEMHQPTGTFYDLVPTGTIVMWYGSTANIPLGWAMCDGGDYNRSDNAGTITTPNLCGRFIVGAGDNGTNNYTAHAQGGADAVTLSTAQMPSHFHSGSTSTGGNHNHSLDGSATSYEGNTNSGKNGGDGDADEISRTQSGGSHSHSFSTSYTGSSQAHENRPMYYALIYIMKL